VSNTRPAGQIRPAASFYVAPDGLKDMWSPFLKGIEEKFPVLFFKGFKLNGFIVIILDTFSYVQYAYTQINNNQMQRELLNNMFEEFIKCFRPFKRATMMLMRPTVKMSLTPWLRAFIYCKVGRILIFLYFKYPKRYRSVFQCLRMRAVHSGYTWNKVLITPHMFDSPCCSAYITSELWGCTHIVMKGLLTSGHRAAAMLDWKKLQSSYVHLQGWSRGPEEGRSKAKDTFQSFSKMLNKVTHPDPHLAVLGVAHSDWISRGRAGAVTCLLLLARRFLLSEPLGAWVVHLKEKLMSYCVQ